MITLIRRQAEQAVLKAALKSEEAEMVSVIGRRRVGKTFLVKQVYKDNICFEITGIQNAPRQEQLQNIAFYLNRLYKGKKTIKTPKNWLAAFFHLIDYLETLSTVQKQVIFLDEIPWLATHKSGFLRALGAFWNSWAVNRSIVVVICGSAASWMIQKVVNHKGGLHNRITKRIHLKPFNLSETEQFLKSKNIALDRYQITQLYMVLGGIPRYLKELEIGKNATQNIEAICFSDAGLLKSEFDRLYNALFDHPANHIAVIKTLATKKEGMQRSDISKLAKLSSGGTLSKTLEELVHSGFIMQFYPFKGNKKNKTYRLTDEYSLFYLQFMVNKAQDDSHIWQKLSQTQAYKTWRGYAFENICLKHTPEIRKALGIERIYAQTSTFLKKGNKKEKGTQIDLVIDRNDDLINLFEIKFYNGLVIFNKTMANNLRQKMMIFKTATKTKKTLFWAFISTFGIQENEYSLGLIQQSITLEDLFT